jgi:hypothetical protein
MKREVLVIVAHPDDETIWMGGTLVSNNWNVTIISLCRKHDKDRAGKFIKVCKEYKAQCFISDLEDDNLDDVQKNEIIDRITHLINKRDYDYIFTHGENGEYGHKRHVEVHYAVREMIKKNILSCKKIFFFAYSKRGRECSAIKKSDRFIKLKRVYLNKKKSLIREFYGFNKNSFEEKSCKGVEAFNIASIK